jgi:hypothetical protein
MIKPHQILLRLVRVEGRNDREFLRQKANAGSEDGNGGDEVQGTMIKVCMLAICLSLKWQWIFRISAAATSSRLAAVRRPGSSSKVEIAERLTVVVAHDEARIVVLLVRPRRRKTPWRQLLQQRLGLFQIDASKPSVNQP